MKRLIGMLFACCQMLSVWGGIANDSTSLFEQKEEVRRQSALADSLAETGHHKEALRLYKELFKAKDQIHTGISDLELAKIKSLHKADKLQLEAEQLKWSIQTVTLFIVMATLVILIIFMVRISHVRNALRISERETRKAMQTAKEANEMKNHFLSTMSYNIRIPLNGVVGFSQLLSADEGIDGKTRKEYTAIIQKNSEELMRLVNDVLDLSRLEAGMMKLQIEKYDIRQLCTEALYMANAHNEGAADILFNDETGQPTEVETDSSRLTQALLSTLACPQENIAPKKITYTLAFNKDRTAVSIQIVNSPLADPAYNSQETSIRHEINRLLLEHFGGSYQIEPDATGGPTIVFTYPLHISR